MEVTNRHEIIVANATVGDDGHAPTFTVAAINRSMHS